MDSDLLFLRYAFPCAHVLLQVGAMTKERYEEIEEAARKGEVLSREIMEESFPAAFRRIRELAGRMGVGDYWDRKVMEEYWYRDHQDCIDRRDGSYSKFPTSFCDFCKVHVTEVVGILPEGYLLIKYDGKRRAVCGDYISDVKIGDKVRVHHAYAIEKVD